MMKIEKMNALEFFKNIKTTSQDQLKKLSQEDRKALKCMLEALKSNRGFANIDTLENTNALNNFVSRLRLKQYSRLKQPSNVINRIQKAIKNLLHLRVSSSSLQEKIREVDTLLSLKEEKASKEHQFGANNDLLEFRHSFFIPTYSDIADFFERLPENREEAKGKIEEKIGEMEKKIREVSEDDPNKEDKTSVWGDEIRNHLNKMKNCHQNNWNEELRKSRKNWQKAKNQAENLDELHTERETLQSEIEACSRKIEELSR